MSATCLTTHSQGTCDQLCADPRNGHRRPSLKREKWGRKLDTEPVCLWAVEFEIPHFLEVSSVASGSWLSLREWVDQEWGVQAETVGSVLSVGQWWPRHSLSA